MKRVAGEARNGEARNGEARNGEARNSEARSGEARMEKGLPFSRPAASPLASLAAPSEREGEVKALAQKARLLVLGTVASEDGER